MEEELVYLNKFSIIVEKDEQYFFGRSSQMLDMSKGFYLIEKQKEQLELLKSGNGYKMNELSNCFGEDVAQYLFTNEILIKYFVDLNTISSRANGFYEREKIKDAYAKITSKSVIILGCGGLGTHLSWNLLGMGIGKLILVDYDVVELSNLNRQLLFDTNDIGRSKVDVLKEKLNTINPQVEIVSCNIMIDQCQTLESIILQNKCDLIIKSIDTPEELPFWLDYVCKEHKISYISGTLSDTFSVIGPTYIANMNTKGYSDIFQESKFYKHVSGVTPSLSCEVSHAASQIAAEAGRVLLNIDNLKFLNKVQFEDILIPRTMNIYSQDDNVEIDEEKKGIYNKNLLLFCVSLMGIFIGLDLNYLIWFGGIILSIGSTVIYTKQENAAKSTFINASFYYFVGIIISFIKINIFTYQDSIAQSISLIFIIFILYSVIILCSVAITTLFTRLKMISKKGRLIIWQKLSE